MQLKYNFNYLDTIPEGLPLIPKGMKPVLDFSGKNQDLF